MENILHDDIDYRIRFYKIINDIVSMLESGHIEIVILEDVYLGLNSSVLTMLSEIRGMLLFHLVRLNIDYYIIHPIYWKNKINNMSVNRKDQKDFCKALYL